MTKKVDFDKYALFVDGVTSNPSKNYQSFIDRRIIVSIF